MPIWDVDAAGTAREIGSNIWDMDAAGTARGIQSVWDVNAAGMASKVWDSTVHVLINGYSQPGYSYVVQQSDNLARTGLYDSYFRTGVVSPVWPSEPYWNGIMATISLNLTSFSTLTMTYRYAAHAARGGLCGTAACALKSSYNGNWDSWYDGAHSLVGATWGGSSSGTLTWNVSSLSSCVLQICARKYANHANGIITDYFDIKDLYLN